MDEENKNVLKEIFWPAVFIASLSFVIAVFPRFIITFGWASDDFLSMICAICGVQDNAIIMPTHDIKISIDTLMVLRYGTQV